ncbi:MAG TPA: hypothetical protein VEY05_15880, partial [Beijerinckiaceae bacterium]|nr:hypothetical protein [Beijerinckiaceae bacterium]
MGFEDRGQDGEAVLVGALDRVGVHRRTPRQPLLDHMPSSAKPIPHDARPARVEAEAAVSKVVR